MPPSNSSNKVENEKKDKVEKVSSADRTNGNESKNPGGDIQHGRRMRVKKTPVFEEGE
ncbi:hypothetical protein ACFL5V_10395 [Fibrobacterota bacterium]